MFVCGSMPENTSGRGGEIFDRRAVLDADVRAHDTHEQQRNELDDRGRHLKPAREDLLGFEKHAAADDDADDERDRRRQTVFFLQIVSHGVSLRCVCAERFYAPPPGESKGSVRRI